jgi:mannitol/fructose-specific phosphotransferase system IIA component (Ntr-type)
MALALPDLLDEKLVTLDLRATTADEAIREIITLMAATGKIEDADEFLEQVLERERASPPIIEHGVAFPHARTDLVKEIVLGIGRSRGGVPFGDVGERARLIFVIAVPRQLITDYLVCVGALARLTKDDATRTALLQAQTTVEFLEELCAKSALLR